MPARTLVEFLEDLRRLSGDAAYVERRGYRTRRTSYAEVVATAVRLARELEARGVERGQRVLLWGENGADWVATFFGCLCRGAVVVPLDPASPPDFARRVAEQVEARLLIRSERNPSLAGLPELTLEGLRAAVSRHDAAPYPAPALAPSDPAEIIFTSGTTAEPKGVVLSHRNLLVNLEPIAREIPKYRKYERLFHPVRFLTLLPLSHVFGQYMGVFIPALLGGTVVFLDTLNPGEVIRAIKRERITAVATVPRLLETLRDKIERDAEAEGRLDWLHKQWQAAAGERIWKRWWRFRRLRRRFGWKFWAFVSGGAALPAETEEFWRRLGFLVIQGYGLTETASLISVNHPAMIRPGSIGYILPGHEVKLGEGGEILIRGENVAAGYWQGRALQPVRDDEGWFHTGDLGALDAEGRLYFKGRKKNVIVTPEGMNVYSEDLEAVLRAQPEVRDCVVFGLARDANAEPCAVLLLAAGADAAAVIQRANRSLAEYQQIRQWLVWPTEDFPRTVTQKPQLPVIQAAATAQLAGRAGAAQAGSLAELVARITGRPVEGLTAQQNLAADLGLSSIERVELLSALEDRYQVELNETRFASATTVGELEEMLRRPAARRTEYVYPRWPRRWPITWIRALVYYLLIWPALALLAYPRIRGREHLRGPLLVVSNHITRDDVGFILAALPRRLRHRLVVMMEGERLRRMRHPPAEFNLLRRWLERVKYVLVVALFNTFPLPQQSGFRESFAFAGECVDAGYSVLVFPEGGMTRDGRLAPFRSGIGLLVKNLELPVLPLRIDGLFEVKQAGRKHAAPGRIKVTIGEAVHFPPESEAEEIAQRLERVVASLGEPPAAGL